MPREAPLRFGVTELDRDDGFVARVAAQAGLAEGAVRDLLAKANDRLLTALGIQELPLQVIGSSLRVNGVVGLLRLAPRIELEIAPKCLGLDAASWREDFFFVANLSRFGRLLASERMSTGVSGRNGLVNLMASALVQLYWDNHRRPLRTYRTQDTLDFDLVGEVDPEDLVLPQPDGYAQRVTAFTSANPYNSVVLAAARQLLTEVDDAASRQQLVRVVEHLSPQEAPTVRRPARVPSRHQRWQPLYDLSAQVLDGFRLDLSRGPLAVAPGFVLRPEKAWEDVVTRGAKAGLPGATVRAQVGHTLGTRNDRPFRATPDVTAELSDRVLADAKYIGRADATLAVAASDVYEGLAFLRAAECTQLVLLYPRRHRPGLAGQPTGTATPFERIDVDDLRILAVEVEARGISAKGGFRRFSTGIGNAIRLAPYLT